MMQAAGLLFLFGMVMGDVGGSAVAVRAMRSILQPSYAGEMENVAAARVKTPFDAAQCEAVRRPCAARPPSDRRGK
jgi:hypothetical protein